MKSISLILALHNHQPVGNFDHVIEHACQKAYFPFLDTLDAHPGITCCIHNTGCLARWIRERHPEYFERLRTLVEAGRIEMMGGAFHEPILPVIPEQDRIGQINKLSDFVRDTTGAKPRGMWLAERVWEPQLPSTMSAAGMEYTVLDDSHFFASGLGAEDIFGYWMTEDNGAAVAVFPTSERLRYLAPFGEVEEVLDYLHEHATEDGKRLAILGDDGEKFGVWPQTFEHCYEDGWLEKFFAALEENADWIKLTTFTRALSEHQPLGRVYLPTASYIEMMTWALPNQAVRRFEDFREELEEDRVDFKEVEPFVRGGFWRNFLAKYEESNQMHKRMLRASAHVAAALEKASTEPKRKAIESARELVWEAQCNCGYWHGVFGGLYLPHLRSAIYDRLLRAEGTLRGGANSAARVERVDFDGDGFEEVLVDTPSISMIIKPNAGGSIVELDDMRTAVNLSDTLTRRPEAYHRKVKEAVLWGEEAGEEDGEDGADEQDSGSESIHDIVRAKEPGLEKHLVYDWYRRSFGLARFMSGWTTLEDFVSGKHREDGDFVNQPFKVTEAKTLEDGSVEVALARNGGLYQAGGPRPTTVKRTIRIEPDRPRFLLRHDIENHSKMQGSALFGVEMVANVLAPDAEDRYCFVKGRKLNDPRPVAVAEEKDVEVFGIVDEWRNLRATFEVSAPCRLWRSPIQTVSLSEAGFERVYQGTCFLPNWMISLKPGEKISFEIAVRLEKAKA